MFVLVLVFLLSKNFIVSRSLVPRELVVMGNTHFKSKRSKKRKNSDHNCKYHCFGTATSAIRKQLSSALKQWEAEYALNIIMDFLPQYSIVDTEFSPFHANDYFHEPSTLYYKLKQPPCEEWLCDKNLYLENGCFVL